MTLDTYSPPPPVTVSGTGPYAFARPYAAGTVTALVLDGTSLIALAPGAEFTVSPASSTTGGNVTLSTAAAALHAGRQLVLIRDSNPEQGWAAVQGGREAGLEAQLDALAMAVQDLRAGLARALRLPLAAQAFAPAAGRTLTFDANGNPVLGPTVGTVEGAAPAAAVAVAAAAQAVAAAQQAEAAEASLIRDAGVWATGTAYTPSDLATQGGSTYVCLVPHTSGTFSTDLTALRWRIFAAQGPGGAGSGDVLGANNGAEFASKPATRDNLGLGAVNDVQHGSLLLRSATPRLVLSDSAGAPVGAERIELQVDNGAVRQRALSEADALVAVLSETLFGTSGATEHRLRVGATNRLVVTAAGAAVAGLMRADRIAWGATTGTVGPGEAITGCNSIADSGTYYVLPGATDRPPFAATQAAFLLHIGHTAEQKMQVAFRHSFRSSSIYVRTQVTDLEGWSPWFAIGASDTNTLATTSGANVFITGTTVDWTEVDIILNGIRWATSLNAALRFATFPGGVVNSGYGGMQYANSGGPGFYLEYTAEAFVFNRSSVNTIIDGELRCIRALGTDIWSISGYYRRRGESYQAVHAIHSTLANPMSEILLQIIGPGAFNLGSVHYNWKT